MCRTFSWISVGRLTDPGYKKIKKKHGLHVHPCFAGTQGYVFTADSRKPGGFWFIDFRQARVYWASGTMAGGLLDYAVMTSKPDCI